ncbi:Os05g0555450, partial [Oryza sativa Japonica Group]
AADERVADDGVGARREAELGDDGLGGGGLGGGGRGGREAEHGAEEERLADGEVGVEHVVLRHEPRAPLHGTARRAPACQHHPGVPAGEPPAEDGDQRRLASPRWSQYSQHLPRPHLVGYPLQYRPLLLRATTTASCPGVRYPPQRRPPLPPPPSWSPAPP